MASSVRITMRGSAASGGIVYDRVVDDRATGHILFREDTGLVRPCSENGAPIGDMAAHRASGGLENPDAATRRDFTVVAAALFQEWDRQVQPPEVVTRTYW